jgi:ubiquinone biosynthesis protein UbiJ
MSIDLPAANPLAAVLQGILNRLSKLDPQSADKLKSLGGRSVQLQLLGTPVQLTITVATDGSLIVGAADSSADLSLRASPGSVLRLLASGSAGVGQLRIEGDAELARQMERLARSWQPDLDAVFTRPFGDVLGFQLARAARGFSGWLRDGVQRGAGQVSEYLREESRDVVAAGELELFLDQVDDLRDAVDRAEQRLQQLERRGRLG